MKISHRSCGPAVLLAAWTIAACDPVAPPLPENVEPVADDVYLFRHGNHRSLFMVTGEGVIVTDPLNAEAAAAYRAAIGAITDKPVKFVVYSHYHWDRVAGAEIFTAEGARVVAQERCAERFRDNPNPAVVMPDITFENQYRIELDHQSLDLHYFGPSHGDCLTVFLVRPANFIQIVDLVEPPGAAFPENPSVPYVRPHNLRQFFAAVESLAAKESVSDVLASHVQMMDGGSRSSPPTASVSIITEQARFWNAIYSAVESARAEGNVGIDSVVKLKTIDLAPFETVDGYRPEDLPMIMRRFVAYYDMGR